MADSAKRHRQKFVTNRENFLFIDHIFFTLEMGGHIPIAGKFLYGTALNGELYTLNIREFSQRIDGHGNE